MLDLGSAIVAREGLPSAEVYRDVFVRLGDAGVLQPALAARLADWASFRNVLAHFYPVIDYGRVRRRLEEGTGDLRAFAAITADKLGLPIEPAGA